MKSIHLFSEKDQMLWFYMGMCWSHGGICIVPDQQTKFALEKNTPMKVYYDPGPEHRNKNIHSIGSDFLCLYDAGELTNMVIEAVLPMYLSHKDVEMVALVINGCYPAPGYVNAWITDKTLGWEVYKW